MVETLPLNALRAFAFAARHESFKLAAHELHVTPGAVSRQVKQLEARLGVALFERRAHGVCLNKAGRRLADAVDAGLERIASGYAAAYESPAATPRLLVSAAPSFIQYWLLPRLADFEARYDAVEIALEASQNFVEPDWHAGGVRLAIRYGRGPWPGVRAIHLFEDALFPVCSPALLERGPPLRAPWDLAAHNLLHVAWPLRQIERFPGWREWLDAAGARQVKASGGARYSLFGLALDQAIVGRGVALASLVVVADRLDSGVLVAPFGERYALASPFTYDLLLPAAGDGPPLARAFVQWLTDQAAGFRAAHTALAATNRHG